MGRPFFLVTYSVSTMCVLVLVSTLCALFNVSVVRFRICFFDTFHYGFCCFSFYASAFGFYSV